MTQENTKVRPYLDDVDADIIALYKTPEEIARVKAVIDTAAIQTRTKEIKQIRQPRKMKRFLARWAIRWKYGVFWKKKYYVFRLIRNYSLSFIYKLFGIKKIVFRGIEFGLTYRCNFQCHHCLCARIDETEERKELEPGDYERVVDEAMKLGALTFGLEGGEPFVHKGWEKIIQRMKPEYNHIIISSNGYLLDEKLVKKCADFRVDTINLSLDSGIPELHDVFRRKKGSFVRVMRAIELCKKFKIRVILNTVVHKSNLYTDGLIKLLEFSEREKILVNILFAKGVGTFKDKDEMLSAEDFEAFFKIAAPYNYWHIHHMGELKSSHGGEGCPGTKEFVNITPYGDVINCANNHIYLGNVQTESFKDIRERSMRETPFGKYCPCFLVMDPDFMNVYYPLLEQNKWISLEKFQNAQKEYEQQKHSHTNGK
ncbi:radical SAM/SPASM domain-containing protein [Acidobacteriota bacterium]